MDAVKAKVLGNREDAFRQFSQFVTANPRNATAHYELSRIWLERNNVPKALSEISLSLLSDSTNKWIRGQYADLLAFDGQYLKAADVYGRLAATERAPEEYLVRQAMLYQRAEKYKEALAVLDKLSAYIGNDDEVLMFQKQQLYLNLNDVDGAVGVVRDLIRYYPDEPRYMLLLGDLYENNDIEDKAAVAYLDAEHKFPNEPSVQFALVQYYLKRKDTAQFQHYLEKAVMNKEIGMEDRISLLAPFIQYRGADSSARRVAFNLTRKMAEQYPPQVDALLLYADLLNEDNQEDAALTQYKKVIAADSTKLSAWQQIQILYTNKGNIDSLVHYSDRAVILFPKESLVFYFAGVGYTQAKNYTKAAGFLGKAIALQSGGNNNLLSDMLAALGDVYNSDGKFTLSDSCYQAAIRLQPNNASALNNFSYYLSERGENLDEAEKCRQNP
jgi:tetratricopeptide (TPR) repeat protein